MPKLTDIFNCPAFKCEDMRYKTCIDRQRASTVLVSAKYPLCHACKPGEVIAEMFQVEIADMINIKANAWNPHRAPRSKKHATAFSYHYKAGTRPEACTPAADLALMDTVDLPVSPLSERYIDASERASDTALSPPRLVEEVCR